MTVKELIEKLKYFKDNDMIVKYYHEESRSWIDINKIEFNNVHKITGTPFVMDHLMNEAQLILGIS